MYIKDFDNWIKKKKKLNEKITSSYFRVGEIRWVSLGVNVGSEIDGKDTSFTRPCLILHLVGTILALVIPCTSQEKESDGNFLHLDLENYKGYLSLTQLRVVSQKRILTRLAKLPKIELKRITNEIFTFLKSNPEQFRGRIIEESLDDNRLLNKFEIVKCEITENENAQERRHIYDVINVHNELIALVSKNLKSEKYYADFSNQNDLIVVFKNKIFRVNKQDEDFATKIQEIIDYGLSLNIPKEQLDFKMN